MYIIVKQQHVAANRFVCRHQAASEDSINMPDEAREYAGHRSGCSISAARNQDTCCTAFAGAFQTPIEL